jgi:hypothetical protein
MWWPAQSMGLLADFTPALQVTYFKASVLGNSRQHPWAYFLTIMESKDEIREIITLEGPVWDPD